MLQQQHNIKFIRSDFNLKSNYGIHASATSSKPHALYFTGPSNATKTSVNCRGPLKAVNPLGLLGGWGLQSFQGSPQGSIGLGSGKFECQVKALAFW